MKKYHFVGIGGVSMSALAQILLSQGNIVTGCDISKSNYTQKLENLGVKVFYCHAEQNIQNCDFVVYNSAISNQNPELVYAQKNHIPLVSRAELLAEISNKFENIIAISGMHGKSTTTTMIAEVFLNAGLNPTIHLGATSKKISSNVFVGDNKYFITEACEYKNNFLSLHPTVSVVLNVEEEHLDFFKNFQNIKSSFTRFAKQSKTLISNTSVDFLCPTISFGKSGYTAKNIKQLKNGGNHFECWFKGKKLFTVKLNAFGKHNVQNALACIAVCRHFKINDKIIVETLENFKGLKRRFEIKNDMPLIIHDYAHHPVEIKSCIEAIKDFSNKKLTLVFQPHTYSRTKTLFGDFCSSLSLCDNLVLLKTYSAREKYIVGGSAKNLFDKINKTKPNTQYFKSFKKCKEYLINTISNNDILLFAGAGDIELLSNKIAKEYKKN